MKRANRPERKQARRESAVLRQLAYESLTPEQQTDKSDQWKRNHG